MVPVHAATLQKPCISLAPIHPLVNAQKENNFRGSLKLPQANEKVCDENERNKETNQKKNDERVKILLMEGSNFNYRLHTKNRRKRFGQVDTMHEGTICLVK